MNGGSLGWVTRYLRDDIGGGILSDDEGVCIDSEEMLQPFFLCEPPEQVRMFIQLFCVTVAISLVVHHHSATRFYRFITRTQVSTDQRRGLGYTACKAYGIVQIPRLPTWLFEVVGWALVATLMLACHAKLAPRFFLFASFALYFLYFGQMYCDSKHGGHGALLLPSVVLLLALSGGPQGAPWSLVFIKIFLGILYFAAAVSKIVVSVIFRQRWAGSTMQAYLFDSMWSRPHPWAFVRRFQRHILKRWWACTTMAACGLGFELAFLPLILWGGDAGRAIAALIALKFHVGVDFLQADSFARRRIYAEYISRGAE